MYLVWPTGPGKTDDPADDWKPASTNQPGQDYPQVNSEGRVRFRIVAPDAQSVTVSFRDSSTFTKGEDGAWIGYTRPLDEGFHYYTITIDGAEVPDPNSKYYFGAMRRGSGVEVPANDQDFYAVKQVPHGQLREVLFFSRAPIRLVAHLSTLRLVTTRISKVAIRSYICSTVGAKTNSAGARKATPI